MSLLLLFHGTFTPVISGTARAVAGDKSAANGSRGASAVARVIAGAIAYADRGIITHGGRAAAVAGGYGLASPGSGSHSDSGSRAVGGAYARGQGGRGVLDGRGRAVAGSLARIIRAKALRVGSPLIVLTRLVLSLNPSDVTFTKPGASGPYPLLSSIGTLRLAARAGHVSGIGSTESTSVTVSLDNTSGVAARIIGRPLRVRARIYDGADLFFDGTVAAIAYGQTIELQIEA